MSKILSFLFFFVSLGVLLHAQDLHFNHLTAEDGLISDVVNDIIQDDNGFMWIATVEGLCRYDGYDFIDINYSSDNDNAINNVSITSLVIDKRNTLWVGTMNGLGMLDLSTYELRRFIKAPISTETSFIVSDLCMQEDSLLWVATKFHGLYCINVYTYECENFSYTDTTNNSLCSNAVNSLLYSESRGLIIATSEGLDVYDGEKFSHLLNGKQILSVASFLEDKICVKCYDSSNDILLYDAADSFITRSLPLETSAQRIFTDVDSTGVWIALQESGLLYYDINSHTYEHYSYDKYYKHGIKSNAITKLYRDEFHNLWICTFDAGISFIPYTQKRFSQVKDNFLASGLQNNRVRSIYQDSDDDIWVGTKVNGALSLYDRETTTFTHYKHSEDELSLSNDYIFCITEDRSGYLWVATYNGLNLFDKKTGKS